jgi:hypothetical protein
MCHGEIARKNEENKLIILEEKRTWVRKYSTRILSVPITTDGNLVENSDKPSIATKGVVK